MDQNIINNKDLLVQAIISNLLELYSSTIIAIYGIGSYFDEFLPPNWVKNDIDIVVFVRSLEKIPKQDWTDVRYKKKEINLQGNPISKNNQIMKKLEENGVKVII